MKLVSGNTFSQITQSVSLKNYPISNWNNNEFVMSFCQIFQTIFFINYIKKLISFIISYFYFVHLIQSIFPYNSFYQNTINSFLWIVSLTIFFRLFSSKNSDIYFILLLTLFLFYSLLSMKMGISLMIRIIFSLCLQLYEWYFMSIWGGGSSIWKAFWLR